MSVSTINPSRLAKNDIEVIFMSELPFTEIDSLVKRFLSTVKTNTDIAKKEIWFVAKTRKQFEIAYEWDMQNPTGTPINKRLFYCKEDNLPLNRPNIIFFLNRDKRIFCITENLRERWDFWVWLTKYRFAQLISE